MSTKLELEPIINELQGVNCLLNGLALSGSQVDHKNLFDGLSIVMDSLNDSIKELEALGKISDDKEGK